MASSATQGEARPRRAPRKASRQKRPGVRCRGRPPSRQNVQATAPILHFNTARSNGRDLEGVVAFGAVLATQLTGWATPGREHHCRMGLSDRHPLTSRPISFRHRRIAAREPARRAPLQARLGLAPSIPSLDPRPAQWGAIHFHDTISATPAGRPPQLHRVPNGFGRSGADALHLESTAAQRQQSSFNVLAAIAGSQARSPSLSAPTFSYTVYSLSEDGAGRALITERVRGPGGALAQCAGRPPEYGVSPYYNFHSDARPSSCRRWRRPLIDKRVNQIHLIDAEPPMGFAPLLDARARQATSPIC